jgi:hypothetical protein
MNLDHPTLHPNLQGQTIDFVNSAITASADVGSHSTATILLTHIPLYKDAGICTDGPLFSYYDNINNGGVKEQNFLSEAASQNAILQGLFGKSPDHDAAARGMGRDGLILTGHDHYGCDVYHFANRENKTWHAQRWTQGNTSALAADADVPGLREVTVRSMMGEFGGNAALVVAWWDSERARWSIEVANCLFGVQHIWWAVHGLDIVTAFLVFCTGVEYALRTLFGRRATGKVETRESKQAGAAKRSGSARRPKKG